MAPKQRLFAADKGVVQSGLGGGKGAVESGLGGGKSSTEGKVVLPGVVDLDPLEERRGAEADKAGASSAVGGSHADPKHAAASSSVTEREAFLRQSWPDLWPGFVAVIAKEEFESNEVPLAEPDLSKDCDRGDGEEEDRDLPNDLGGEKARRDLPKEAGRGGAEKERRDLPDDSGRGGGEKRRRSRRTLKERLLDTLFSTVEGDVDVVVPGQDAASLLKLGLAWDDLLPYVPEGAPEGHWQVYSTSVEAQKRVTDRASWQRWQGRVRAWVARNLKDDDCSGLVNNPRGDDRLFLGWCLAYWLEPSPGAWRRWPLKRRLQGLTLVEAHWDAHGHGRASDSESDLLPDLGPTPPSPGAAAALAAEPKRPHRRRK